MENLCAGQEQAATDHNLAWIRTGLSTPTNTLKLKKRPAVEGFSFADALPKNRFSDKSLSPMATKACSSSNNPTPEQAKSISPLPASYRTKNISIKTKGSSPPKQSTTEQPGLEGSSPKDGPETLLQAESRAISQEQLVAEVKGIYEGLTMVEAQCLEIDSKQAATGRDPGIQQPKLSDEQWQALIALHRTLLHEHHDFFLASQRPSASPALRRLAAKYTMPARMWQHGIHNFLELLRHQLPESLDHMLMFIYFAYLMMALLYETVPSFEDTWIECLGDLGRYRMAIEDDDIREREVWTGVSRFWYSKPARMWRHDTHSFLDLLRRRLPDSQEHMFPFIYLAKSLMALQHEAASAFEDSWIECLGDLGRYRMAIEDKGVRDEDIWSGAARFWYSKVPDLRSRIGRLYHHLAILGRPCVIQKRSSYIQANTEVVLYQKWPESDAIRGLCLVDEDTPNQSIHGTCSATIGKLAFAFSDSEETMLWYGYYSGVTALCTGISVLLRWLLFVQLRYHALLCIVFCYSTARIPATATKAAGTFVYKPTVHSEGDLCAAAKSCAPGHKRTTVQWLRKLRKLMSTTGNMDVASNTVGLALSMSVAGTQAACESRVMGRLTRRLQGLATSACTLLHSPSLSAQVIRPRRTCGVAVRLLFIRPDLAVAGALSAVGPISTSTTGPLTAVHPVHTDLNGSTSSERTFPILCALMLAISCVTARLMRWDPSNVAGTLAAISWYLWLYLMRYPAISPWYLWSIWSMGAVVLIYFVRLGFQKNLLFFSSVTAIPLTMAAINFLPDLRSDHLAAFPPCLNLSLAFWIFADPFLSRLLSSLFHFISYSWHFLEQHIRRVVRRLRLPWHPDHELPLHHRD